MSAVPGTPTNNGGKGACAYVLKNWLFRPSSASLCQLLPPQNSTRQSDEICGLAKAKALGIVTARIPSSSLDKISAEFLEEELLKAHPELTAKLAFQKPVAPVTSPLPASKPAVVSVEMKHPLPATHPSPKPDNRFANPRMLQQIQAKLQGQAVGRSYSPKAFESDVNRLLDDLFPFSILPGVRLFSSEPRGNIDFGFEMDNLIHLRHEEIDYVVEVEAKHQPVLVDKGRWLVKYDDGPSCAREQVNNHIRTMWEYLGPIARQTELKFVGIIVSSDLQTGQLRADGYRNAELYLCSVKDLVPLLAKRFNLHQQPSLPRPEVLRVSQSNFLDLLRLSLPVEQLGHPELASAIRYVDRCRRALDATLFEKFDPTPTRWVINGSAGMGKSVLLAYAAAVLSSGFELYRALGEIGVKRATATFAKIGFKPDPQRGAIAIMAMSAKQLENLRIWFSRFVEQFQQADLVGDVRFRPPEFLLCRPGGAILSLAQRCSALLVDEAHDIPAFAARDLAALHQKNGLYLVVACDRHQKLQLAGSDAKIIEGLDFTNRSTRLRQIYRNPAPVYIASLALMFRWFADSGPKVIPTAKQMDEQFGFETAIVADGLEVQMRSDAHPANSWCHTVATFPSAATAYSALIKERLGHKDVLWVRFSEEDPDFDYEQLIQHFTYHNCLGQDAHNISDKYIKGQDYPIVVIEGFPGFMDRFEASQYQTAESAEARAWAFRRELYLCASRATTFLYFICNVPETPEVLQIRTEIQRLVVATAIPETSYSGGTKSWKFHIGKTAHLRKVEVFIDTISTSIVEPLPSRPKSPASAGVSQPVNTQGSLGVQPTSGQEANEVISKTKQVSTPPPSGKSVLPSLSARQDALAQEPTRGAPAELQRPVATMPITPSTSPRKSVPSQPITALGEIATISQIAQFLGKDISEVVSKISTSGFRNVQPSTKMNVKFVTGLFQQGSSHQPKIEPGVVQDSPSASNIISSSASQTKERIEDNSQVGQFKLSTSLSKEDSSQPTRSDTDSNISGDGGVAASPPEQSKRPLPVDATKKPVLQVAHNITVQELAALFGVKAHVVVAELLSMKVLRHAHQSVSELMLRRLCQRHGFDVTIIRK